MKEERVEKKRENVVSERARDSQRISSLPLLQVWLDAFVKGFDYPHDRKLPGFEQHNKCYFLLTPVLQLLLSRCKYEPFLRSIDTDKDKCLMRIDPSRLFDLFSCWVYQSIF